MKRFLKNCLFWSVRWWTIRQIVSKLQWNSSRKQATLPILILRLQVSTTVQKTSLFELWSKLSYIKQKTSSKTQYLLISLMIVRSFISFIMWRRRSIISTQIVCSFISRVKKMKKRSLMLSMRKIRKMRMMIRMRKILRRSLIRFPLRSLSLTQARSRSLSLDVDFIRLYAR